MKMVVVVLRARWRAAAALGTKVMETIAQVRKAVLGRVNVEAALVVVLRIKRRIESWAVKATGFAGGRAANITRRRFLKIHQE